MQKKFEMLDSLVEIEIACSLMLKTKSTSEKSVVDSYYDGLKTRIRVLDTAEQAFHLLKWALLNTHADTHNYYSLELIRVRADASLTSEYAVKMSVDDACVIHMF